MKISVPLSVCVVVQDGAGHVLAVPRGDDPEDLGLPGGKVEAGETFEQAIARELLEETGLVLAVAEPLLGRWSRNSFCLAYFAREVFGERTGGAWVPPDGVIAHGWARDNVVPTGHVWRFTSPDALFVGKLTTFADFNRLIFAELYRRGIWADGEGGARGA